MKTIPCFSTRILAAILWVLFSGFSLTTQAQPITPKMSDEIVNRIRSKTIELYQKQSGLEYVEDTLIKTFNSETGELEGTTKVVLIKRNYYYQKAEITTLKYEEDGKELPVSEYKPYGSGEPGYPVFDKNGPTHYDVKVVGTEMIEGQNCYHLKINAKEETVKHLIGDMYFEMQDLELVLFRGSLADLPFGAKKIQMEVYYTSENGINAPDSSSAEIFAHVPFIYPHKKLVVTTKTSQQKYIPRSD